MAHNSIEELCDLMPGLQLQSGRVAPIHTEPPPPPPRPTTLLSELQSNRAVPVHVEPPCPSPEDFFPFMKLPTEVRFMIYDIALQQIVDHAISPSFGTPRLMPTPVITKGSHPDIPVNLANAKCPPLLGALALLPTNRELRSESAKELVRLTLTQGRITKTRCEDFQYEARYLELPLFKSVEERHEDVFIELWQAVQDFEMVMKMYHFLCRVTYEGIEHKYDSFTTHNIFLIAVGLAPLERDPQENDDHNDKSHENDDDDSHEYEQDDSHEDKDNDAHGCSRELDSSFNAYGYHDDDSLEYEDNEAPESEGRPDDGRMHRVVTGCSRRAITDYGQFFSKPRNVLVAVERHDSDWSDGSKGVEDHFIWIKARVRITVAQIKDAYRSRYGDKTMDLIFSFEQQAADDATVLADLDRHNDRIVIFTTQTSSENDEDDPAESDGDEAPDDEGYEAGDETPKGEGDEASESGIDQPSDCEDDSNLEYEDDGNPEYKENGNLEYEDGYNLEYQCLDRWSDK